MSGHIDGVLEEIVQNQQRVPSIRFASVNKEQRLQESKLTNCVVCTSSCLQAFFSCDTNSYMGLQDHAYIIGTVANSQSCFLWESNLDHVDDVCLLLWGDSASQDHVNEIRGRQEGRPQALISIDYSK